MEIRKTLKAFSRTLPGVAAMLMCGATIYVVVIKRNIQPYFKRRSLKESEEIANAVFANEEKQKQLARIKEHN